MTNSTVVTFKISKLNLAAILVAVEHAIALLGSEEGEDVDAQIDLIKHLLISQRVINRVLNEGEE